jgi:hypothetical protein
MKKLNNKLWYPTTRKACHKIGASPSSLVRKLSSMSFTGEFIRNRNRRALASLNNISLVINKIATISIQRKGYATRNDNINLFSYERGLPESYKSGNIYKKNKIVRIQVIYNRKQLLNYELFLKKLMLFISPDTNYKVYIKFAFEGNHYKMAGHQFSFKYSYNDDRNIIILQKNTISALKLIESKYGFMDKFENATVTFIVGNSKYKVISLHNLPLRTEFKLADHKLRSFHKILPLSVDHRAYGVRLTPVFIDNIITHFNYKTFLGEDLKFIGFGERFEYQCSQLVSYRKMNIKFKPLDLYYFRDDNTLIYIDVNNISIKYIITSMGVVIETIKDSIIDSDNFSRQLGNVSIDIRGGEVVEYKVAMDLSRMKPKPNKAKDISNPNFGTIDLETYPSLDGFNKVYAAGLYTKSDGVKLFYIDENLDSDKLVLEFIDAMLDTQFHNYVFYAHNFSGYDAPFILKCLLDHNSRMQEDIYDVNSLFRDKRILHMSISKKVLKPGSKTPKRVKINIHDSQLMLTAKLSKLGESFGVEVVKGVFPHSFASYNTLFYTGATPSKKHYKGIDEEEYRNMVKAN